tara:strand:+ start:373 stop:837 length:465 start_codon:yes stop_codon:yes gene_type:complete
MIVHQLNEIIEEEKTSLIAIHSSIEIYKIAYLINSNCNASFIKSKKDVVLSKEEAIFERYEWKINEKDFSWYLFSNKFSYTEEKIKNKDLLFNVLKTKQVFLIDEFKNVDFFIKKKYDDSSTSLINSINSIPEVIISYELSKNKIKLKHHLIFD